MKTLLKLILSFLAASLIFSACEKNDEFLTDADIKDLLTDTVSTNNSIVGTWVNTRNDDNYANCYIFSDTEFIFAEREAGYYMERDGKYNLTADSLTMDVNSNLGDPYIWQYDYSLNEDTLFILDEVYIKTEVENPLKEDKEPKELPFIEGTWLNIENTQNYSNGFIYKNGSFLFIENEAGYYMERNGNYELSSDSIFMHVNSDIGGDGYDWNREIRVSETGDSLFINNEIFIKSEIENPLKDIQPTPVLTPLEGTWIKENSGLGNTHGFIFNEGAFTLIKNEMNVYSEMEGEFTQTTDNLILFFNSGEEELFINDAFYEITGDTLHYNYENYILTEIENPLKDFSPQEETPNSSTGISGVWLNTANDENYSTGYEFKDGEFVYFELEGGSFYLERDGTYELGEEAIVMHVNSQIGGDGYDWNYNFEFNETNDNLVIDNQTFVRSENGNTLKP